MRPCLLAAALAVTVGCGDGLLDQQYQGEPMFTFAGQVASDGAQPVYVAPLRAAVFWLPYDPTQLGAAFAERTPIDRLDRLPGLDANAHLVEQATIAVAVRFPGVFSINIFAPPPAEAIATDARLRFGVVLLYEDRDGDERMTPGEVVGAAPRQLVLFADQDLAADDTHNPTGAALPAGYAAVDLPLRCGVPSPEYDLDPMLDVRLGAACTGDGMDACGALGTCLTADLDGPLPDGYCVLLKDDLPTTAQPPLTSALIETERDGNELEAWYRECMTSADCRPAYTCQQHVCLPAPAPALVLNGAVEVEAACAASHESESRQRSP
ncbi:MAG: hypothetical protein KC620_10720 [Myxococcales bacterium]|nr:hypothetical protein [Myxococcales bacterium]